MKTGNGEKMKIASASMLSVLLCLWIAACKPIPRDTKTGTDSSESFSKIYDRPDKATYTAVDIKQTDDGGYIILGKQKKEEPRPYVLRLDREGSVLWETSYDDFVSRDNPKNGDFVEQEEELDSYIEPISDILIFGKEYYIFCSLMKRSEDPDLIYLALLKLSETEHSPSAVQLTSKFGDYFVVPMDAKTTADGHILLFALNVLDNNISFQKINCEGFSIWENNAFLFDVVCSNQYPVIDNRYNFIEPAENPDNNGYYFHGYYNSNISYPDCFKIMWFKPPLESQKSTIKEWNMADRPFIAMAWSNGKLFGARLDNNTIRFVVNSELNKEDIEAHEIEQLELRESSTVCIKSMDVNNRPVVFFVGSAKSNRIVLYTYNLSDGRFSPKKYFGHTHIYEASALIETIDNGLAILGTTYVAGQLGRLCLFKLSKTDLDNIQKGVSELSY